MPAEIKEFKGVKTIPVNPEKEYVAGGFINTGTEGTRTLSGMPEDTTRAHSAQTYETMMSDPKVSKAIHLLKMSVLSEGVEFRPSLPEKDENYESAEIVADFCKKAVNGLDTPIRYTLEQMLDALIYGHKIAEVTYKTSELTGYEGTYLVPSTIKTKGLNVVQFVVDNKFNILGFAVRQGSLDIGRRQNAKITLDTSRKVLVDGKPVLPREKFMVLTIRGKDCDPRGHSVLSSAVNAWHLKTAVWPEYLKYLLLCAIPLLVGATPENDTGVKEFLRAPDGTPIKDPVTGAFIEANPVIALRDAMLQARNGEVLAVKGGTKISEIGAQGAGTPFFKAIELFDSQMETGILLQTLATSEGIHQNRAASTMHMSVLDQFVYWLKGVVVDMLVADLLRPVVRYNFGDDALQFMPNVSLGDTERREFANDATAIATLYKAGYFQPNQLKQTDEILGFEVRDSVDPQLLVQQLQGAGVPIVAVPPPPQQVAEIQSGPGGGVQSAPLETNKPKSTTSAVKFPATGRVKGKLNRSPKNIATPEKISQLSESEEEN